MGPWLAIHASNALEQREHVSVLRALRRGGRNSRMRRAQPGVARLHSCGGRFAGAWLTTSPCSSQLRMENASFVGAEVGCSRGWLDGYLGCAIALWLTFMQLLCYAMLSS